MNGNAAHFEYYLQKYPVCRTYLELICTAWKRYGRLPSRIVLERKTVSIPHILTETFGPGALHISKNGVVSLVTDRLFGASDTITKERWVKAVHDAAGIMFTQKDLNNHRKDDYALAVNKWCLMFPQLKELAPLISQSRSRNVSVQELLELWIKVGNIVSFLWENMDVLTVSDLGARFCNDSKALRSGEMITLVADWLTWLDTGMQLSSDNIAPEYRKAIRRETLGRHNVVENRCSVVVNVFGPLVFEKHGKKIDIVQNMWSMGEGAPLSLENLDGVERIDLPDTCHTYTCENESPFANMIRKNHPGLIIYTRGFPNSAVCRLYRLVAQHYPDAPRFHWGDTDFAGLQIASIFHKIAPLRLWRCDTKVIMANRSSLLPIDNLEKEKIRNYLDVISDFPFREELELTYQYGWLEQERFEE